MAARRGVYAQTSWQEPLRVCLDRRGAAVEIGAYWLSFEDRRHREHVEGPNRQSSDVAVRPRSDRPALVSGCAHSLGAKQPAAACAGCLLAETTESPPTRDD